MSRKVLQLFLVTVLSSLTCYGLALYGYAKFSWGLVLLSQMCLLFMLRAACKEWSAVAQLFALFSIPYALSGPAQILFGQGNIAGFPPMPDTSVIDMWLMDVSLAVIAFGLGFVGINLLSSSNRYCNIGRFPYWHGAVTFAALASLSELINMLRAGGLSLLFAGKAVYQAAVSDISFTIPSDILAQTSFALLGLSISNTGKLAAPLNGRWEARKRVLLFALVMSLLLGIHTVLGQRIELIAYLVCFMLGYTYHQPLQRLSIRWLFAGGAIYALLTALFAFRGLAPALASGQITFSNLRMDDLTGRYLRSLNPASNEFRAAFGNYYLLVTSGYEPQYGATPFKYLQSAIPAVVYPGQKPPSPTYEFRDRFFPERASRSRIAGTAFSSIMEARMNFGASGVFVLYAVIGALLAAVERFKRRTQSPYFALLYCYMGPLAATFHRSGTGIITSAVPIGGAVLAVLIFAQFYTASSMSMLSRKST